MYTLFGYIISLCLILNQCFVSCYISGEIKKINHARRKSRIEIFNIHGNDEIVPTVDDEVASKLGDETNDFLKKSLVEFFEGVKQTGDEDNDLLRAQKRTIKPNVHKNAHHKLSRNGKKRQTVSRVRNDTDTSGSLTRKCIFPFINNGESVFKCLGGETERKWCSLTNNYDRDATWTYCEPDGTPVRRSKNIESLTEKEHHTLGKKKSVTDGRKHEKGQRKSKKGNKRVPDEVCDTCDRLPKNNTDAAVRGMQEEIDDVDKSDKEIHSLVSKEVDNFIGSVLAKHGVPDTEQKELLALNAKLSTELAQEVSCKMSNETIGKTKAGCENANKTSAIVEKSKTVSNLNKTSYNQTVNDELLSTEVDAFINSILSQHNISASKQKEILKSIRKASTDISDQISYVVAYAKAGDIGSNKSERALGQAVKPVSNVGNNTFAHSSIHAAVDNFLGFVLEKHGVPVEEQDEILDWNAQLSTDIADQVNAIVEKAEKSKKSHGKHSEWKSQLKPNITFFTNTTDSTTDNILETRLEDKAANNTVVNDTVELELASHEIQRLPDIDTLQPIYNDKQDEDDSSHQEHTDKEAPSGALQAIYRGDDDQDVVPIHENNLTEGRKSYDDVSPENDIEIGVDDTSSSVGVTTTAATTATTNNNNNTTKSSTDDDLEDRGIAPDVIDAIAPINDEAISPPAKIQFKGSDVEESMTSFANKEFNKKPKIHSKKKSSSHKMIASDENWDKYLMDDGWVPKSTNILEKTKNEEIQQREDVNKDDKENFSGEKELNEDEKSMINYVSDSIIQSVKNVEHTTVKDTTVHTFAGKGKDITYKKLDSGKKPYLIYRVQQGGKTDSSTLDQPGIDSVDTKSQKIIPGTKNINIIIINNRNNSLDLNDIENTIARSGDPTEIQNETDFSIKDDTKTLSNTSNTNKTSESLFLLINTTQKENESRIIKSVKVSNDNKNATHEKPARNISNSMNLNSSMSNNMNEMNTTGGRSNETSTRISIDTNSNNNNNTASPNINTTSASNANITNNTMNLNSSMLLNKANVSDDLVTGSPGNELEIDKKSNESNQYVEPVGETENKNISFSKLLIEYDKNLETSALQSLRKSGLISMNYAPEEIEVRTFGGNSHGSKCMFPFIYDGDTYFNCINVYRDKPWCSTTANYDKLPVWGFCDNDHPVVQEVRKNISPTVDEIQAHKQQLLHNQGEELISKHSGIKTYGGNAYGAPCVIPFVYDGQTHMKCIPKKDGTAWCAASHSYDIHPIWGNCCDNEKYKC